MGGKTTLWRFQAKNSEITHKKTWTWLRNENLRKETENFSESSTKQRYKDYVKARIDKKQQNNRCRLCGSRDKTINHIIRECSKLAQKRV